MLDEVSNMASAEWLGCLVSKDHQGAGVGTKCLKNLVASADADKSTLTHRCPTYSLSLRDADMDVGGRAMYGAVAERVGESEARGRG